MCIKNQKHPTPRKIHADKLVEQGLTKPMMLLELLTSIVMLSIVVIVSPEAHRPMGYILYMEPFT